MFATVTMHLEHTFRLMTSPLSPIPMFLVACTAFIFITTTMYLLVDDSFFNSQSIRCSHVAIINQVHALGEQEKMSNGCLEISNQMGQFFYDSACLVARVYYDKDKAFDEAPNDDCKNEDNTDNDSNEDKQREEDCVDEVDSDEFNQVNNDGDDRDDKINSDGINDLGSDNNNNRKEIDAVGNVENQHAESGSRKMNTLLVKRPIQALRIMKVGLNVRMKQSGRVWRPPAKLMMAQCHHFHTQVHPQQEEYSIKNARSVIAMVMCHINENLMNLRNAKAHQFVQSYSRMKGLKTFCQLGRVPAFKDRR